MQENFNSVQKFRISRFWKPVYVAMLVQLILYVFTLALTFTNTGKGNFFLNDITNCFQEMLILSILIFIPLLLELRPKFLNIMLFVFPLCLAIYRLSAYLIKILVSNNSTENAISLSYELSNFLVFTYAIFCFLNHVCIFTNKKLSKGYLIIMDYIYFTFAFVALIIKYIETRNHLGTTWDIIAFILGALAIALRITKTNGEYILNLADKK